MAQTKVKLISDGVIDVGHLASGHGITTDNIGEGSNLYYTDARVSTYLSTNSYATESWVNTNYLALSGGTLTGQVVVSTASSPGFKISKNASTDNRFLRLENTESGGRSWDIINQTVANSNALMFYNHTDNIDAFQVLSNGNTIIKSGNENTLRLVNYSSQPSLVRFSDTSTSNDPYIGSYGNDLAFGIYGVGESMRINSSRNVGIGTTSPNEKLSVNGAIRTTGATTSNESGATIAWNNTPNEASFESRGKDNTARGKIVLYQSYANGSNGLRVLETDSSGNIGIGTSPSAKLDILGATQDQLRLRTASTEHYRIGRDSSDGLLYFYGSQSGYTGYVFSGVNGERMRIDSSGNVGIATTSPAYKLQVNGDMRVTSNVRLGTDLDTSVTIGQAQNSQSTSSDTKLVLSGKNLEAGGTYYGDYGQLLFNATANYTGSARKWLITNGLDAYKFSIIMGDSGQVTPIIGTAGGISNGTPVITMDDSARVGIGTTLPDQKFHVNGGTTNVVAHFQSTDSVGGIKLSDSTGNVELTTNSSSGFDIRPNGGSAVFTITSGGNVGINTTSPAADLDVNGSTRFRGDTYNEYTFTASGNYTSGTWYDAADTSTLTASGIYIIQMYLDDYGAGGGTYFCWYVSVPFMWVTTGTNRTTTINFPELIGTGHATGTLPTFRLTQELGTAGAKSRIQFNPNNNWTTINNTSGRTFRVYFKRIGG